MMAVTFQQKTALTGRARGVQARDRFAIGVEHAVEAVDRQTAFVVHEDRSHRA